MFNYRKYAKIFDETVDLIDHLYQLASRVVFKNLKKVQIDNINQLNDQIEREIYIADDEFMAAAIGDVEWLKQSLRDAGQDINFDKNVRVSKLSYKGSTCF